MAGAPEDYRIAVGFSVTLSGQLVQAAVTLLTVQGAYVAYALASRETKCGFELIAILAFFTFIVSIYFSGKGVTEARNAGFEGKWGPDAGKAYFNKQAILLLAGVAFLVAMLFLSGNSKESDSTRKLAEFSQVVSTLDTKMKALSLRVDEGRAIDAQALTDMKSDMTSLRQSVAVASKMAAVKRSSKATKNP
jgi:hypothetical protein